MTLDEAIRLAIETLENVRGNINPERGFCDELEADVQKALDALTSARQ